MGYLFLTISLLCGTTKGYCGKKTSNYTKDTGDAMLANFLRMVLCVIIGFGLILVSGEVAQMRLSPQILAIAALSGISTSVFVVSWLLVIKKGAYMMVDVFLMMGVLVPLVAGMIFLKESITFKQWIGVVILLEAVLLMCSYSSGMKGKLTPSTLGLLILSGAASGVSDFSQKLFVRTANGTPVSVFNFYTYVFAMAVLGAFFLIVCRNAKERSFADRKAVFGKIFGYVVVMAVCLFASSYFKTRAAMYLDSIQLYPLSSGCALILASAMSSVCFGEKMTKKSVMGLVLAFMGLIVINVL